MKIVRIYVLKDPVTLEIRYVGQTVQKLMDRLRKHLKDKDKCHRVNWIKSVYTKYKKEPIIEQIDEAFTKEEGDRLEIMYIKNYKEAGIRLTNMTIGGDGSFGYKHSEESLEKMRNKIITKKTRKLLKINGIKQWENTSDEDKLNNMLNQKGRRNIVQKTLKGKYIKTWISLRQIERELGFFRFNIGLNLKGKQSHAYGYLWKYEV